MVAKNHDDISKYTNEQSLYSYYFHFERKNDWGRKCIDFGGRIGEKTRKINNIIIYDIDESAQSFNKINKIKQILNFKKIKDGSVDMVYISHTLEHIKNPYQTIEEITSKIKKEGYLIIVSPCEDNLFETYYRDPNWHLHTWNSKHLVTILENLGYDIEKVRYVGFPLWLCRILTFDFAHKLNQLVVIRYLMFLKGNLSYHIKNFIFFIQKSWGSYPSVSLENKFVSGELVIWAKKK